MTELCDEQNEAHVRHGVVADASIAHKMMPGRPPYDGHDPNDLIEDLLARGYVEVDLDGRHLADVKIVGWRLFVRVQE